MHSNLEQRAKLNLGLCLLWLLPLLHLPTNILYSPTRQRGERAGFRLASLRQLLSILGCSWTRPFTGPRVAHDVSSLKVGAITGFLKDEIFGKVGVVIAQV